LINGTLSGGTIDVVPEVVGVGDTIMFTVTGVTDSGGQKRVNCTAEQDIWPVAPTYTWELTIPPDFPEPLPPLSGTGQVVSVVAEVPGTYTASFTATANRECPPPSRTVGPAGKEVVPSATLTANPTDISATSVGTPWNYSIITVAWIPPECEGTLEIVTPLVGNNNYSPPNDATGFQHETGCGAPQGRRRAAEGAIASPCH
jgi:hypothetical protein